MINSPTIDIRAGSSTCGPVVPHDKITHLHLSLQHGGGPHSIGSAGRDRPVSRRPSDREERVQTGHQELATGESHLIMSIVNSHLFCT